MQYTVGMPRLAVTPSPNRSRPPQFSELDDKLFEEMCTALFDVEEHLCNVDLYGVSGQAQFGVDIIGYQRESSACEVVSCKCYQKVTKANLKSFSDDFLEYWDAHWAAKGVRRFILAVAAPIESTQLREAIDSEIRRFQKYGVTYEAWGPRQLQARLRPHRGIVSQYLGEEFVPRICGRSDAAETAASNTDQVIPVQITAQMLALQQVVAGDVAAMADACMYRLRRGDNRGIEKDLSQLRSDALRWTSLPLEVQARILRLLATCRLNQDDVGGAQQLADDADRLHCPLDEPRLRALIAYHRNGPEAALAVLGEPVSRDGVHLHIALLISAEDFSTARSALGHPALTEPDAETWRLRAMLALEENNREEALDAIHNAEGLASDWPSVHLTGGVVRYAVAISAAVPARDLQSPNPIDLDLVREDAVAKRVLEEAEHAFARWLEVAQEDEAEQRVAETWRLAVLACRRQRIDDAATYARGLLRRDRTHWGAIVWSLARGFDLDVGATLRALEDLLDARRGEAPHLVAAVLLLIVQNRLDKAKRLFGRHAARFETPDAATLLAYWRRRLASNEDHGLERELLPIRLGETLEQSRNTGDWRPVVALLEHLAAQRASLPLLLPACQALAASSRWTDIRPYIDTLASQVGTAEALRVAAFAALNTGDPSRALALIEAYPEASGAPSLPIDLKRLRIAALHATGDVAGALHEVQALSLETGEPRDLLRQAELGIQIGNLSPAVTALRNPIVQAVLEPRQAVQWAGLIKPADPETSRALLSQAVAKGLPDEVVPIAVSHSFHLAAAELIRQLMPKMARLATASGNGLVRRVDMDALPRILAASRETTERLFRAYVDGQAPIHVIAGRMGHQLAATFDLGGQSNAPTPLTARAPLMIRHGGRPPVSLPDADIVETSLHLDITALLLAHGLGLLDILDAAGATLVLPRSTSEALYGLECQARECQPDRVAAWDAIRHAVLTQRVSVEPSASITLDHPNERRIHRVVFASQAAGRTIEITGLAVISLRSVLDALQEAGCLDPDQYNVAIEYLGPREAQLPEPRTLPQPGDTLSFAANTIETMALAGLLDVVAAHFLVWIDRDYLDHIAQERAVLDKRTQLADSLKRLRDRMFNRLEARRWRILPLMPASKNKADDGYEAPSTVEWPLLELLRIPPQEPGVLWIDDRWVSRHHAAEGHAIVGITDLLAALRTTGRINEARYFACLLRLRRARAHFIQITAEEVVHHLRGAQVGTHGIVETAALRTVRQSLADAVLLEPHWGLPPPGASPEERGELAIGVRTTRLFDETLVAIWQARDTDETTRIAWAEWARGALPVRRFERIPLVEGEETARSLFSQCLAFTLTSVVQLFELQEGPARQRSRELMEWLDERVLTPALLADPDLAPLITEAVCAVLLSTNRPRIVKSRDQDERVWKAYLGGFVAILPDVIRSRLHEDRRITEAFGIVLQKVTEVDGLTFDTEAFWSAMSKARGGTRTPLRTIDGRTTVAVFRPKSDRAGGYRIVGPSRMRLADEPAFAVLDGSENARRAALEAHPAWFDCPAAELENLIEDISSAPTAGQRMVRLLDRRRQSVPYRREQWRQQLAKHEPVDFTPTSALDLLRYVRVDPTAPCYECPSLHGAASRLVVELGPAEAARRLGSVPMSLPRTVVQAFDCLTPEARHRALADLAAESAGPVMRMQVLALMRRFQHPGFAAEVDRLLDGWPGAGEAFIAILRWTEILFARAPDWSRQPPAIRLALTWIHADHVADALLGSGASQSDILRYFQTGMLERGLDRALVLDCAYEDDAAFPDSGLDAAALLFHGLTIVVAHEGATLLSREQRQRIESLLHTKENETKAPKPSLLRDRRANGNSLDSFLIERPAGIFDALPDVGWEEIQEVKSKALTLMVDQPNNFPGWALAHLLGGFAAMPQGVQAALEHFDVTGTATAPNPENEALLRITADFTARISNPALIDRYLDGLVASATIFEGRYPAPTIPTRAGQDDPASTHAALVLLETLGALSKRTELKEAAAFFANGLQQLSTAWPQANAMWRHVANGVHDSLPFAEAEPMWRTSLHLRAEP